MKTIAVVTLYFPDASVRENIAQLSLLVDKVALLDNTSEADNSNLFQNCAGVEYIAYRKNLGLSDAFNRYLCGLDENCYIVFFDQDSFCPDNLISQLKQDYLFCCGKLNKKGVLGSAYFEKNANRLALPKQKKEIADGIYQVKSVITSGMFTELDVLRQVGFWNAEIFLDMADWDLCWRVLQANLFCCLSRNAVLTHRLGNAVHRFLGMEIQEWAVVRIYYQIRDCLCLLNKKYSPLKFKIKFILMLTVRPFVHLIILPEKRKYLHYYFKGIKDYKNKVFGELKEEKCD